MKLYIAGNFFKKSEFFIRFTVKCGVNRITDVNIFPQN